MADLKFISDTDLRKTIEDAIEYIFVMYEETKAGDQNERYLEEKYRVIILYVVSAIEAVLMHFYKVRGEPMLVQKYKHVRQLGESYQHTGKQGRPVVIAVQDEEERREPEIGLHDLIEFFRAKNLIKEKTAEGILEINDVRNTFHLSKPRTKKCDVASVEQALGLLVHTLDRAPRALRKKA